MFSDKADVHSSCVLMLLALLLHVLSKPHPGRSFMVITGDTL